MKKRKIHINTNSINDPITTYSLLSDAYFACCFVAVIGLFFLTESIAASLAQDNTADVNAPVAKPDAAEKNDADKNKNTDAKDNKNENNDPTTPQNTQPNETQKNTQQKIDPAMSSVNVELPKLIQKLGDESFVVRERAENRLLQIGAIAESELREALRSDDVEIARRAELILSRLEQILRDNENEAVREVTMLYASENDPNVKLTYIWMLAVPLPGFFTDGEGLTTLCRIARFDKDKTMRIEAAKSLLSVAPTSIANRDKWQRTMLRIFENSGDEPLFVLVRDYASLRLDVDAAKKAAEREAELQAKNAGKLAEYPVKLPKSKSFEDRLKKYADDLSTFQKDPSYSVIKPGYFIDILVLCSLAELQDDLGLIEERDKTLAAALALRQKQTRDQPVTLFSEFEGSELSEHYLAASVLDVKQKFSWAEQHLKLIVESDAPTTRLKTAAYMTLARIKHLSMDLTAAIECLEKCAAVYDSEQYKNTFGDSSERIAKLEVQKLSFKAQLAAEKEDWKTVKELVDKTLTKDPFEIDTLILRHKLYELNSPIVNTVNAVIGTRGQLTSMLESAIANIYQKVVSDNEPQHVACNQVAWLLANVNGEFAVARDLIEFTIKNEPDDPTYLDTQAHVYILDKQYDKAIEIQQKAVKIAPEAKVYRAALEKFKKLKEQNKDKDKDKDKEKEKEKDKKIPKSA